MSDLLLAYLIMGQLLINTTEFAVLDANKERPGTKHGVIQRGCIS